MTDPDHDGLDEYGRSEADRLMEEHGIAGAARILRARDAARIGLIPAPSESAEDFDFRYRAFLLQLERPVFSAATIHEVTRAQSRWIRHVRVANHPERYAIEVTVRGPLWVWLPRRLRARVEAALREGAPINVLVTTPR